MIKLGDFDIYFRKVRREVIFKCYIFDIYLEYFLNDIVYLFLI